MTNIRHETIQTGKSVAAFGLDVIHQDKGLKLYGAVDLVMVDAVSGEILQEFTRQNIITYDAGILIARLLRDSTQPSSGIHNGPSMLAVGTGATGSLLSPDAPQRGQRKLNSELARKAFSSVTFRDSDGNQVAYPTNVVDFTTTFQASEAVGAWNEMGLVAPFSQNPMVTNPINNGPSNYNAALDVTSKDLFLNYLTFPVISKPSSAIMKVTWRITL